MTMPPNLSAKSLLPLKSDAPDRDPFLHEALVVGLPPWNLTIAHALARAAETGGEADGTERRVTTADALPLREDPERGAFDLIVVVLSMTSRLSFERARETMKAIGQERPSFIIGRWALVVCNAARPGEFAVPMEDVVAFADRYQLPLFCCEPSAEESLKATAGRLAHLLRSAARTYGLTPLFGPSTDVFAKRRAF